MDEYIEREVATNVVCNILWKMNDLSTSVMAKALNSIPAADVAPVRHGRWLCVDTDTEQFFLCNRCKKKEYWESSYCPACGAKMDGDMENNRQAEVIR